MLLADKGYSSETPDEPLTEFQIFDKDSDTKGTLPEAVRNLEQSP